jgi:hypothetical protein
VGSRFKRVNRMEYEDIMVTEQQNQPRNGYGLHASASASVSASAAAFAECPPARAAWRALWADFYQVSQYY